MCDSPGDIIDDALEDIENLTLLFGATDGFGNELDNVITGNDAANFLFGNEGADTLDGGIGIDTLSGGLGNDVYLINSVVDQITELENAGDDTTIYTNITSVTLDQGVENLVMGLNVFNAIGNQAGNPAIIGDKHRERTRILR